MKLLQKLIIILLLIIYGYSQSVFSHLAIIERHHKSEAVETTELHNNGYNHLQGKKIELGCEDKTCQQFCESIEYGKIVNTPNSNSHTQHNHQNESKFFEIKNNIKLEIKYNMGDNIPISISILMNRIGPIVRII